jgi:hypothetical protein
MCNRLRISIVVITLVILGIALVSSNVGWSDLEKDKDYCYDEVGDGHFCFDTKKNCIREQKSDAVAESPCYNMDRN